MCCAGTSARLLASAFKTRQTAASTIYLPLAVRQTPPGPQLSFPIHVSVRTFHLSTDYTLCFFPCNVFLTVAFKQTSAVCSSKSLVLSAQLYFKKKFKGTVQRDGQAESRVSTEFRRHGIPRNFLTSEVISSELSRKSLQYSAECQNVTSVDTLAESRLIR
jgi:hypothetical protein